MSACSEPPAPSPSTTVHLSRVACARGLGRHLQVEAPGIDLDWTEAWRSPGKAMTQLREELPWELRTGWRRRESNPERAPSGFVSDSAGFFAFA